MPSVYQLWKKQYLEYNWNVVSKKTKTFTEQVQELENLVTWFESTDFDLDQAVDNYEKGMKLIQDLEEHLKTAENKVAKIKASFE